MTLTRGRAEPRYLNVPVELFRLGGTPTVGLRVEPGCAVPIDGAIEEPGSVPSVVGDWRRATEGIGVTTLG